MKDYHYDDAYGALQNQSEVDEGKLVTFDKFTYSIFLECVINRK